MESELRELFHLAISQFGEAENLPIYRPNVKPSTNPVDQYLRVSFLPTDPELMTVKNAGSRYTWLLQVSFYTRDNSGELELSRLIDRLKDTLKPTTKLSGVNHIFQVVAPGFVIPPVTSEPGWYFIPVQFRIQSIK